MGHVFDFNDAKANERWFKKPGNQLIADLEMEILLDMLDKGIDRKVTYFFGAVTLKDLFLVDEMKELESKLPRFSFVPALSAPEESDNWQGLVSSDGWEEGVLHIPLRKHLIDVHLHMGGTRRGRVASARLNNDVWYHVAVVADTRDTWAGLRLAAVGAEQAFDGRRSSSVGARGGWCCGERVAGGYGPQGPFVQDKRPLSALPSRVESWARTAAATLGNATCLGNS